MKLLELHYLFKEFKMAKKKAKKKTEKKTTTKKTGTRRSGSRMARGGGGGVRAGRSPITEDRGATDARPGRRRAGGGTTPTRTFARGQGGRNRGR
jgi:hypothetical protein